LTTATRVRITGSRIRTTVSCLSIIAAIVFIRLDGVSGDASPASTTVSIVRARSNGVNPGVDGVRVSAAVTRIIAAPIEIGDAVLSMRFTVIEIGASILEIIAAIIERREGFTRIGAPPLLAADRRTRIRSTSLRAPSTVRSPTATGSSTREGSCPRSPSMERAPCDPIE
jgi:hypothetical protein